MTDIDFNQRLLFVLGPICTGFIFLAIAFLFKRDLIFPGLLEERTKLLNNPVEITRLEQGSWAQNLNQAATFSSVAISALLIVMTLISQNSLDANQLLFMVITLVTAAVGATSYLISIQFWNCAFELARDIEWRLKMRKRATFFQVIGWYCLIVVLIFCVVFLNSIVGFVFSCVTTIVVVTVHFAKTKR